MKRIPRQVPATRGLGMKRAATPPSGTHDWPAACAEARARMPPRDAALLDRLQNERCLRLERGLLSEANGIELAMWLICESAASNDDTVDATDLHPHRV